VRWDRPMCVECSKWRARGASLVARFEHRSVCRLLRVPPLCREMQTTAKASIVFDARKRAGWDASDVLMDEEEGGEEEVEGFWEVGEIDDSDDGEGA
jgi:hypothetical protein